jgi:hypothetical protein
MITQEGDKIETQIDISTLLNSNVPKIKYAETIDRFLMFIQIVLSHCASA